MKSNQPGRRRLLEKLEDRVLFDACPDGNLLPISTVFDNVLSTSASVEACPQATGVSTPAQPISLVFIASSADDVNARLNEVLTSRPDQSFQVHWLDAGADAVAEIGRILESVQGDTLESVWFLLDNQDGWSAEPATAENNWWLQQPGAIAGWSTHLSADSKLMLPGVENSELAEQLERLTGATVQTQSSLAAQTSREIIFVDTGVENYQALLENLLADRQAEVILLDPASDGVLQIAAALEGRSGLGAIHLISHGSAGVLYLGTATLDAASMQAQYLPALTQVKKALHAEGDILIYGCNFTAGDQGLRAAIVLGGITQADIAASNDLTGHQ